MEENNGAKGGGIIHNARQPSTTGLIRRENRILSTHTKGETQQVRYLDLMARTGDV